MVNRNQIQNHLVLVFRQRPQIFAVWLRSSTQDRNAVLVNHWLDKYSKQAKPRDLLVR